MLTYPDKEGVWEWFDDTGNKKLVLVCDMGKLIGEQWLRVYWCGGYYNVIDGIPDSEYPDINKSDWPMRWGKYIGNRDSVPESLLSLGYTYGK